MEKAGGISWFVFFVLYVFVLNVLLIHSIKVIVF